MLHFTGLIGIYVMKCGITVDASEISASHGTSKWNFTSKWKEPLTSSSIQAVYSVIVSCKDIFEGIQN